MRLPLPPGAAGPQRHRRIGRGPATPATASPAGGRGGEQRRRSQRLHLPRLVAAPVHGRLGLGGRARDRSRSHGRGHGAATQVASRSVLRLKLALFSVALCGHRGSATPPRRAAWPPPPAAGARCNNGASSSGALKSCGRRRGCNRWRSSGAGEPVASRSARPRAPRPRTLPPRRSGLVQPLLQRSVALSSGVRPRRNN